MNDSFRFGSDVPLGLGMALAKDTAALEYFNNMNTDQRQAFINGTKNIKSKEEMRQYVNTLTTYTGLN